MSGARTVFLGLFMALISTVIVLGSLSLSLLEGGYVLAQAPTAIGEMVFESEPILNLAGSAETVEAVAPSQVAAAQPILFTVTPSGCPHPASWVAIVVRPEDTLRSLAHRYSTSVHLLKTNNCLTFETLPPNSTLYVPDVPPLPTPTRPRPTYPWTYPTPYPTIPYWPTATPWYPTPTIFIPPTQPPPTLPPPPTNPPPPTATQPPPATKPPPTPTPPPPTEPPPTQPPPPTDPPPTEPPPPTDPPPPTVTVETYPFP